LKGAFYRLQKRYKIDSLVVFIVHGIHPISRPTPRANDILDKCQAWGGRCRIGSVSEKMKAMIYDENT